ncbi:hypothetical protein FNV43_RR00002 [Rhamnella rubrinervis]|uniref:ADP-ribosyl cyclase/cyclic ADP-ribose hydrolase n=1 Tax=Rhamnella rubrinervis TaxID=2594499 RepID=A0A8K0HNC6_9ROSA|nr:hypothetical protein FNV43_RR00002 [Rhamnella rubrinervis]
MEQPNAKTLAFASSSSLISPPAKKYDVFLSFRGEDTRLNFTGFLYAALCQKGIFYTFKDDYELEKGKDIGPKLMNAIEDSHYAVVVLSKNYAASTWCLNELAKIVDCMGDSGRIQTIFYHVNPSNVRKQMGSFGQALAEHQKNPRNSSEDVKRWRNALTKVADLSAWHVEDHT